MEKDLELKSISVIIPMYNAEFTVERALMSVIHQNYCGHIEVIIVNDGSKDDSVKVVERIKIQHSLFDIKLINQENGGVSKARNTGLKIASGAYLAFLDADDEWMANKLSCQIPYLDNGFGDFVSCLRNDDILSWPYRVEDYNFSYVTLTQLLYKVVGQTSTAVFKRHIFEELGGFDENQRYSEDANYWMKIAKNFKMIIINEKLVLTGGGKPSVGHSGLSANINAMEDGVQKNIEEMRQLKYINFSSFLFFKIFSKLKFFVRKIKLRVKS